MCQLNVISKIRELDRKVVLAVSLLKNNNFELVLQKCVELGVSEIIPFESSRTVVKSSNFSEKKFDRFRKIMLEASEQSKRSIVPKLYNVHSINELCELDFDNKFVAYESSGSDSLLYRKVNQIYGSIIIIIGPEGGFSSDEIKKFENHGYSIVSLGNRILRAETAAIAAISNIIMLVEHNMEV